MLNEIEPVYSLFHTPDVIEDAIANLIVIVKRLKSQIYQVEINREIVQTNLREEDIVNYVVRFIKDDL